MQFNQCFQLSKLHFLLSILFVSSCQKPAYLGGSSPYDPPASFPPAISSTETPATAPDINRTDILSWIDPSLPLSVTNQILSIDILEIADDEADSSFSIAIQQYEFGLLADSGAAIVSGSQALHPQAIDYTGITFIHYDLGNLFFDQWYLAHYNASTHLNKA